MIGGLIQLVGYGNSDYVNSGYGLGKRKAEIEAERKAEREAEREAEIEAERVKKEAERNYRGLKVKIKAEKFDRTKPRVSEFEKRYLEKEQYKKINKTIHDNCSICMESMIDKKITRCDSCCKFFDDACVNKWLAVAEHHRSCPSCKQAM